MLGKTGQEQYKRKRSIKKAPAVMAGALRRFGYLPVIVSANLFS